MFSVFAIAAIALLAGWKFYRYATQNGDHFVRLGIPHMRPRFLFGNMFRYVTKQLRPDELLREMYTAFPNEKLFGFFLFRVPTLFATDPELIKHITVRDFDHFADHKSLLRLSEDDLFGKALPMLNGSRWRQMRATLSPAFTGSKMRQMFVLVDECTAAMCRELLRQDRNRLDAVDMKDMCRKYANDVIATTAFGVAVNSFRDPDNAFLRNGEQLLRADGWRTLLKIAGHTLCPRLMRWLRVPLTDERITEFFRRLVVDSMDQRRRENITRPDVVDLLMRVRSGELDDAQPTQWTDDEIVAQCFLFFLAGFDTVSNALSTLAYELAVNADVQQRLYAECRAQADRLGGATLTYDQLQRMPYVEQVVSEALRMWTPVMFVERECVRDYEYRANGDEGPVLYRVPKGMSVWIPIHALHHDERLFAEPERFEPERFGAERKATIVPGTYMPFGMGPRNCIASRFALMELKAAIYHLMLNFRLEPCAKTQIPLRFQKNPGQFVFEQGIHIRLVPRESHSNPTIDK